jgi:hypothetical protein
MPVNQQYKHDMSEAYDYLVVPEDDSMVGHTQRIPMRKGALLVSVC